MHNYTGWRKQSSIDDSLRSEYGGISISLYFMFFSIELSKICYHSNWTLFNIKYTHNRSFIIWNSYHFNLIPWSYKFQWKIEGEKEICSENWEGQYRLSFGVVTLLTQFLIPASVRSVTVSHVVVLHIKYVFQLRCLSQNHECTEGPN